jgi:hypothetical protein
VTLLGEAGLRVVVQPAVGAAPRDVRLAEIVEQRREPHPKRGSVLGRRLHDCEGVLVDGERVVAAFLLEADRTLELGQHVDEDAGVAREPQRPRRLRTEEELRQLAHPVRREPAADPLPRDKPYARSLVAHLLERARVGFEPEL